MARRPHDPLDPPVPARPHAARTGPERDRRRKGKLAPIPTRPPTKEEAGARPPPTSRTGLTNWKESYAMGRTIQPIKDRLLRYRDVSPDGCWLWTASKNNAGYGHLGIRVDGRRRMIPVHRVAYEHFIGPIPEGLQIDHLCRVRACFNPEHLEPVSSRINTLRGTSSAAVNAAKTHCDRGHEFTPENTYLHPAGYRRCRTCQRRPDAAHRSKEAERSMTDLDAYHCRLCDGLLIDNGNAFETEVTRHQDGACFGAGATVRAVIA